MDNIYYQQKFKRADGSIVEQYVWSEDLANGMLPKNDDGSDMEIVYATPKERGITIINEKMTPQQVQSERKQRATKHFKREILPTLGRDEKIHHTLKNRGQKK